MGGSVRAHTAWSAVVVQPDRHSSDITEAWLIVTTVDATAVEKLQIANFE